MTRTELVTIVTSILLVMLSVALLASVPEIQQWERQHDFPYGKMCQSIFTGWSNTCR